MPRSAITVQELSRLGIVHTYENAETDGNSFVNDGKTFLIIKNGAVNVIVTILTPRGIDGQATTNRTVTVDASTDQMLGPYPPGDFNQFGSLGDIVHIDYDDITNVQIGVFRI